MSDPFPRPRSNIATLVGLFCALGVPLLLFSSHLIRALFRAPIGFWRQETVVWGLTATVVLILLVWERLPLSAIGLRRLRWSSLWWGIAGAVAIRLAAWLALAFYGFFSRTPLTRAFAHDFGTAAKIGQLPLGLLLFLALRAAVTEEVLFRGYGISRLSALTGSRALAALVSLAIFTLAHLGVWDLQYLVIVFPAGLVLTLLYLWRGDLWANMFAHFFTDAIGLAAAYALAHHLMRLNGFGAQ